jgi:DNA-binding response OmpR family regulator
LLDFASFTAGLADRRLFATANNRPGPPARYIRLLHGNGGEAAMNQLHYMADYERARDRHSGKAERVRVCRGNLVMLYDPLEFYFGAQQIGLSPLEGAILELLITQGRASAKMLNELFEKEGGSIKSMDVHVHRIRRKFDSVGAADPIETVRGWGLKFRYAGEMRVA